MTAEGRWDLIGHLKG